MYSCKLQNPQDFLQSRFIILYPKILSFLQYPSFFAHLWQFFPFPFTSLQASPKIKFKGHKSFNVWCDINQPASSNNDSAKGMQALRATDQSQSPPSLQTNSSHSAQDEARMFPLHLTPLALDWLDGPGGGGDVGVVRGRGKGLFRGAELGGDLGTDK